MTDRTHHDRASQLDGICDSLPAPIVRHPIPVFGHSPCLTDNRQPFFASHSFPRATATLLPRYVKPLPLRITPDDVAFLECKNALAIPDPALRNELLRCYIEFVHPCMPLLDLHDFLHIIDGEDGSTGKVSLLVLQAVMFTGSAFVDMRSLAKAGYASRKEARKSFFQKARVSRWHSFTGENTDMGTSATLRL